MLTRVLTRAELPHADGIARACARQRGATEAGTVVVDGSGCRRHIRRADGDDARASVVHGEMRVYSHIAAADGGQRHEG